MITLYLLHPVHKTPVQDWSFEQVPVIRIGRSTSNDVVLYSAVVSRHHVEIHRTESGWQLKNIGTNGTYIDGKRVAEAAVSSGLVLRLARSGPIIQIQTDQEKGMDPLQQLLAQRSAAAAKPAASHSETVLDPDAEDNPFLPQSARPEATFAERLILARSLG